MKKLKTIMLTLVSLMLLTGCSTRYGALTVATTKNIDINMATFEKVQEGVTGKSTKPIILIIPTGTPSIEDAIDAALKEVGGDIMQNVVIYYKWFYIPYIYGEYTFEVQGDVWKMKSDNTGIDEESLEDALKVFKVVPENESFTVIELENKDEFYKEVLSN